MPVVLPGHRRRPHVARVELGDFSSSPSLLHSSEYRCVGT